MKQLTLAPAEQPGSELGRLWRGELPLRRTYWLYWFCVSFCLGFARGWLEGGSPWLRAYAGPGQPGMGLIFVHLALLLVSVAWTAFMVAPLWRSARRYEGLRLWRWLAMLVAALGALGVAIGVGAFSIGFVRGFTEAVARATLV